MDTGFKKSGGEGGIRTLDTGFSPYNASTDYYRTSWFKPTTCSRRTGAGRLLRPRSPQAARRW
jgi:hypothetical protein